MVTEDWIQLMRYGWYPATRERVNIAFTFRTLDLFHELTFQGKTSLHDFHRTMNRITNNSGVGDPKVRGICGRGDFTR